jgi:hypothetical protein
MLFISVMSATFSIFSLKAKDFLPRFYGIRHGGSQEPMGLLHPFDSQ